MGSRHTASLAPVQPRRPRDTLGRPLSDLRISVTDRCNFRCPYCMPRERYHEHYRFLKSTERLGFEEIVRLARLFLQLGARKLRITGGEPLLRAGLADLIGDLTTLPGVDDVALTTNGVLLPQHAAELRAAGLQRVTVSLDSLDPQVFARMAGDLGSPEEVLAGIAAAQRAGLAPIKINAVVQRGVNEHTVLPLLEYFRGTGITVRLIEYMDVGNRNEWQRAQVVPSRELLALIGARWPLLPLERTHPAEVAKRHAYADGAGEIGLISSVSQPFCGDCSRARLSSDGVLYTCLFATHGLDLRAPLRAGASDEELLAAIRACWSARADRYSELRGQPGAAAAPRVEMNHVGG
ncbi:MAG: GTP 3',8-cyclase MoaA [Gammaproteobacteria bacterium]|nr:GTP 3',8-cyclase MoaA [Gammaproteobacteria bacterium]